MKDVLKNLRHNGVYVPVYDFKGFKIKILGKKIKLSPMSEQMAIAWIRKKQSILSPPDKIYEKNFKQEFLEKIKQENSELDFINTFSKNHLEKMAKTSFQEDEIDFSEVSNYLDTIKQEKQSLSKIEKKVQSAIRKALRLERKEKYGYAIVDGKKLEIANWIAEPSCLFAGRGDHPRRGKWKEGPKQEEIILNLSPESPTPPGKWKEIIWEPEKMYVAKWMDKLTGKIKYVWFSDSAFIKQNKEKEKFEKAAKLGKRSRSIEKYIIKNLKAKEDKIYVKKFYAKMANLRVAEVANHKRKISPKFGERLLKKEEKLKELKIKLKNLKAAGKKTKATETRIEKISLDIELTKQTKEYNLGTSLKSYIDPRAYKRWARSADFDLTKFYPKTLQTKFSWALEGKKPVSDIECKNT